MATFPNKPASYSVNTGHAKCPDYLYMLEGNTNASVGGVNLTQGNSPTWGTADLGGGGPASSNVVTFASASSQYAWATSGFSSSNSVCLVLIWKSTSTTNPPSSAEAICGVGENGTDDFHEQRITVTNGYLSSYVDSSTMGGSSTIGSTDLYDTVWHMTASKTWAVNSTTIGIGRSTDGAAWTTTTAASTDSTQPFASLTRIGLATSVHAGPASYANITAAGLFIYKDDFATWDNTWIASLYADPWQFLTTTGLGNKLSGLFGGKLRGKI